MKKFFALLLSIMLLSTAALAEVKIGQVEYAAHGTSCFAVLTVAMDGDTIVAAHIDEFQFMDAATAEGVPNSDASFGQNYPEGKVLASKVVNDGLYSTNMTTKAGATTPLGVSYNAIEAFVTGKTIAENLEGVVNRNPEIIRPIDNPYSKTGGIAVLKGNLAPEGSVIKHTACPKNMFQATLRARPFDSEEECIHAVLNGYISIGKVRCAAY